MKRDLDNLNWRGAFPDMPQSCREALLSAARMAKEERPMKKISVTLIAAALLIAVAAVALAAACTLGWVEFYQQHYDIALPESAGENMAATLEPVTLGDVRFTVRELGTDGHIVLASVAAQAVGGEGALLCTEPGDPIGAMGDAGERAAAALGVDAGMTWREAAQALGCALWTVRAAVELPPEHDPGFGMEDVMPGEDGVTCFAMTELAGAPGDALEMQLYLAATRIDPATGETAQREKVRVPVTLALPEALETGAYVPTGDGALGGLTLTRVTAERTALGVYLTAHFAGVPGADEEALWAALQEAEWLDARGEVYPTGASLSASLSTRALPEAFTYQSMVTADALPETLTLRAMDAQGEWAQVALEREKE